MQSNLLFSVLPLAIAGALSPTMFGLMTVILRNPKHTFKRGLAFAVGAAVPIVILTLAILTFLANLPVPAFRQQHSSLAAYIDIVVGLIFLVAGIVTVKLKPQVPIESFAKPHAPKRAETNLITSLWHTFWFGFGMMAINGTTLLLLIPAAKTIASSDTGVVNKLTVALIVDLIMLSSVIIPLIIYVIWPKRSEAWLAAIEAWLRQNTLRAIIWLCFILATFFLLRGLINLH